MSQTAGFPQKWRLLAGERTDTQPLWFRIVTTPFEGLYGAAVRWRMRQCQPTRLPGAVVSVGNLAVGGTGKTPVVLRLAEWLTARGVSVAILTRGYGRLKGRERMVLLDGRVHLASHPASWPPDEARLQSVRLPGVPVVAGPKRAGAARWFLSECPDLAPRVWLLDDGFQHLGVHRDRDVVLLAAPHPFGNGRLLPRGILREGSSALTRADAVVMTHAVGRTGGGADVEAEVRKVFSGPVVTAAMETTTPVAAEDETKTWPGGEAFVVTGIAKPSALREGLERLGIRVVGSHELADHGEFPDPKTLGIPAKATAVVTTGKDYWRDPRFFAALPQPIYVAPLHVHLTEEEIETLLGPEICKLGGQA